MLGCTLHEKDLIPLDMYSTSHRAYTASFSKPGIKQSKLDGITTDSLIALGKQAEEKETANIAAGEPSQEGARTRVAFTSKAMEKAIMATCAKARE